MAMQNVWLHLFLKPGMGVFAGGHIRDAELVRTAILKEFDENGVDSSLPLVAHIWDTLSVIFTCFTQKRTKRMGFENKF
jgi:hypothetical protein